MLPVHSILVALAVTHMAVKGLHFVKMTSSSNTASLHIQELQQAYFNIKMQRSMLSKKKIHYLCEDGEENQVPRDHLVSSFGKPRDAKR